MPINVIDSTSVKRENKINTSLFVQQLYLRTNYIGSKIEKDIDMKNS